MSDAQSYQLVRKLGGGISGVVYLARNESVAVRQFASSAPRGSAEWEADRTHFVSGARKASELTHPNVVRILEVIEEEGEVFVAMENIRAETLSSAIAHRRFAPAEANQLLRMMAMTLDIAHQRGVVHGDFKPSNVFLVADSGVKISDFAISPRASRNRGPVPQQWIHPYLSPEHLLDPNTIGPPSDQYSLAAIAYQFYCGEPPYAGADAALRRAMESGRSALSNSTAQVLLKALSRNRAERYPSCTAFVEALEASTVAAATRTAPALLTGTGRKFLYAGGGIVLAALAGAGWWALSGPKGPAKTRESATVVRPVEPARSGAARSGKDTKPSPAAKDARSPAATESAPPPGPQRTSTAPAASSPQQTSPVLASSSPLRTSPAPAASTSTPARAVPGQASSNPAAVARNSPQPEAFRQTPVREPVREIPAAEPRHREPPLVSSRQSPAGAAPAGPAGAAVAASFEISIYSRRHKIEPGLSFSYRDPALGELGHGDLQAFVQTNGPAPRGKLTLEWVVDDVPMDVKPVTPNQLVEYGNEPTAGQYRVTLKIDSKPIKAFVFRITP
jgi:eukaryotic-like serine/threonine-protein kinase